MYCGDPAWANCKGVEEEGWPVLLRNTQAWSLVGTGSGVGYLAGCSRLWMS